MSLDRLLDMVIALVFLAIALPIILTNFSTARTSTGSDSNFTAGLDLSNLLLGLLPVFLILVGIRLMRARAQGRAGRGGG